MCVSAALLVSLRVGSLLSAVRGVLILGDWRGQGVGLNPRTAILGSFYSVSIRSLDTVESTQSSASEMRDVACFGRGWIQTETAEEVRGWG